MKTLLLDTAVWDLCKDVSGGIAVATDPYSVAQDVAAAARTFLGECYYDTSIGVPYFQQILGQAPPLSLIKAQITKQAARVPGCVNPVCFISSVRDRVVAGQVQFTDGNGQSAQTVAF